MGSRSDEASFAAHVRAVLLLPGMVIGVIPAILCWGFGGDTANLRSSSPAVFYGLLAAGGMLMICGVTLLVLTNRHFALRGKGTLAPWNPTRNLVVTGVYRYVRNPMISGVLFVLLGEASATASLPVLIWFLLFWAVNAVYIPLCEEPGLEQRFGDEYRRYRQHVPRWIPRWTPWIPDHGTSPNSIHGK